LFNNADGNSRGSGTTDSEGNFVLIPKRYRKLDLKHNNKDDGDYDLFNKTKFCGLEAQLPNNYCNAMLEVSFEF
jgi:PAB-dependent poly(A)-specific ribonuclease subunit 2